MNVQEWLITRYWIGLYSWSVGIDNQINKFDLIDENFKYFKFRKLKTIREISVACLRTLKVSIINDESLGKLDKLRRTDKSKFGSSWLRVHSGVAHLCPNTYEDELF